MEGKNRVRPTFSSKLVLCYAANSNGKNLQSMLHKVKAASVPNFSELSVIIPHFSCNFSSILSFFFPEDNFPLASSSQQSSLVSAITGSATSSSAQVSDGGSESVGEPLVKVKGKKFTAKEGSKVNQPKNDDDNGSQGNLNVGKGKGNLKMNGNGRLNVLVKGKKFAKEKNNAGGDDEDDGQNRRKGKQQQKV